MLANIGSTEIIIMAVIVLILFGGKKLPEMGKGLGDALKEFKNAFGSDKKETKK
jgi:sec-independent protein translocase protein TatA